MAEALLQVEDLVIEVPGPHGMVRAVDGVSFTVDEGEVLALVGESGSGKSLTMLAVMDLLPPRVVVTSGRIVFRGEDLLTAGHQRWHGLRGSHLSMVFQDPMSSLNPLRRVGAQVAESVRIHAPELGRGGARERALELLDSVGVPEPARRARLYPHQWSGGMRQRAMVAMAVAHSPDLLVADEPTTALDVTVQKQVMGVLDRARARVGAAMVLITHDMGLVAEHAHRVAVMYSGRIVETGTVSDVVDRPQHPYSSGLMASVVAGEHRGSRLPAIPGTPPSPAARPAGCAFQPRCDLGRGRSDCSEQVPVFHLPAPGRGAACHVLQEASHAQA